MIYNFKLKTTTKKKFQDCNLKITPCICRCSILLSTVRILNHYFQISIIIKYCGQLFSFVYVLYTIYHIKYKLLIFEEFIVSSGFWLSHPTFHLMYYRKSIGNTNFYFTNNFFCEDEKLTNKKAKSGIWQSYPPPSTRPDFFYCIHTII